MDRWEEGAIEMTRIVLTWMFSYCLVQVVDIAAGHPMLRLANWLAMHGEPERDSPYRPSKYTEGDWRRPDLNERRMV